MGPAAIDPGRGDFHDRLYCRRKVPPTTIGEQKPRLRCRLRRRILDHPPVSDASTAYSENSEERAGPNLVLHDSFCSRCNSRPKLRQNWDSPFVLFSFLNPLHLLRKSRRAPKQRRTAMTTSHTSLTVGSIYQKPVRRTTKPHGLAADHRGTVAVTHHLFQYHPTAATRPEVQKDRHSQPTPERRTKPVCRLAGFSTPSTSRIQLRKAPIQSNLARSHFNTGVTVRLVCCDGFEKCRPGVVMLGDGVSEGILSSACTVGG